jgi:hypothetical protein
MRTLILGAVSAMAIASPAVASDLAVTGYREKYVSSYEYRTSPRVVIEEAAPVVSETVVVRRPVVVAPAPAVVEEESVYSARRVYAAPRVYASDVPWHRGWGYRHHLRDGW